MSSCERMRELNFIYIFLGQVQPCHLNQFSTFPTAKLMSRVDQHMFCVSFIPLQNIKKKTLKTLFDFINEERFLLFI